MIPGSFYVLFLVFIGVVLLVFAYGLFSSSSRKKGGVERGKERGKPGDQGVCPVCGSLLTDGAQIKSAVFPGEGERLVHIFGCPHCHPYAEKGVDRGCPVCKRRLAPEGYLIARLFERPNAKRHVHILGCVACRLPKRR